MNKVTARQRLILQTLLDHLAAHGAGLTVRELGARVGLSSSSSTSHQLHRLEKGRLLTRSGKEWTTATLTSSAIKLLARAPGA
ncbi:LexA family protein [Streptomyces sp. IBSNAI002]|uniref:LexA family protein n=1 Tax=Streptomyces sp. IBSNAI002 TaxID=3457500 RepID=UPI003FD2AFA8